MNVYLRNKHVGTDTVYDYTPYIDDSYIWYQLFVCENSLVSDLYSIKTY